MFSVSWTIFPIRLVNSYLSRNGTTAIVNYDFYLLLDIRADASGMNLFDIFSKEWDPQCLHVNSLHSTKGAQIATFFFIITLISLWFIFPALCSRVKGQAWWYYTSSHLLGIYFTIFCWEIWVWCRMSGYCLYWRQSSESCRLVKVRLNPFRSEISNVDLFFFGRYVLTAWRYCN